ncbi:hypothetical protein V8G54_018355, partial [Vigna mungo]
QPMQPMQEARGHSINIQPFASAYMRQPLVFGHGMNLPLMAFFETMLSFFYRMLLHRVIIVIWILITCHMRQELVEYFQQIDNVSRGLSEETITRVVKTKTCLLPNNLDGVTSKEQETDLCVICQDEYKNQEEIGILQCQHRYHANCIRRWLHEKNVCPICKSEVLDFEGTLE